MKSSTIEWTTELVKFWRDYSGLTRMVLAVCWYLQMACDRLLVLLRVSLTQELAMRGGKTIRMLTFGWKIKPKVAYSVYWPVHNQDFLQLCSADLVTLVCLHHSYWIHSSDLGVHQNPRSLHFCHGLSWTCLQALQSLALSCGPRFMRQ